jgi:hypothetical protein
VWQPAGDTLKLFVEVVGPQLTVPRRHLKRGVTEDSAEAVEVPAIRHEPTGEAVQQIVVAEILDPSAAIRR